MATKKTTDGNRTTHSQHSPIFFLTSSKDLRVGRLIGRQQSTVIASFSFTAPQTHGLPEHPAADQQHPVAAAAAVSDLGGSHEHPVAGYSGVHQNTTWRLGASWSVALWQLRILVDGLRGGKGGGGWKGAVVGVNSLTRMYTAICLYLLSNPISRKQSPLQLIIRHERRLRRRSCQALVLLLCVCDGR